eukprot:9421661-Pyramimonas_sp.AAC.1
MALDLAMRIWQVEAATLVEMIIGANSLPVARARARVKAWIEQAQEMRLRKKEGEIETKLSTISRAALAGIFEGCDEAGVE